jgi:hypothetical protein
LDASAVPFGAAVFFLSIQRCFRVYLDNEMRTIKNLFR